mmetsp:Transcript_8911/g.29443  ORF Transcript_8911/g.29443 Transcript_8911/m.29443 type:complete len:118 (+) Transcript_8911:62-415(+)
MGDRGWYSNDMMDENHDNGAPAAKDACKRTRDTAEGQLIEGGIKRLRIQAAYEVHAHQAHHAAPPAAIAPTMLRPPPSRTASADASLEAVDDADYTRFNVYLGQLHYERSRRRDSIG